MISRATEVRNANRRPGKPWQPPVVPDTTWYSQDEGIITESIRGNQVAITVRLRRTWAVMMGAGNTGEFRESFAFLRSIWRGFDLVLKVLMCLAVANVMWQVVSLFLPGGPGYQVLEGLK
jgi:hypothetical protein